LGRRLPTRAKTPKDADFSGSPTVELPITWLHGQLAIQTAKAPQYRLNLWTHVPMVQIGLSNPVYASGPQLQQRKIMPQLFVPLRWF